MAGWPTGFDPFYGLGGLGGVWDPFAPSPLMGGGAAPGLAPGGLFFDPYWTPGTTATTRRRLNAPTGITGGTLAGAGAAGAAGGEGTAAEAGGGGGGEEAPVQEPGGRRTREPYTMGAAGWTRSIPCDFIEREDEYLVRADIPGCKKAEIHIEVHNGNVLRFGHNPHAEREKEDEEEEGIFHRAERVTTFRNRNLRMPDDADMSSELKASYEDGVLHIVIPKKKGIERREGRVIEVA